MTEENGPECPTHIAEDDDAKPAQEVIDSETSANPTSKESAINTVDNVNSAIDDSANAAEKDIEDQKAKISWTLEGEQYKVSWSLPKGVATPKDFIALCRVGKCYP